MSDHVVAGVRESTTRGDGEDSLVHAFRSSSADRTTLIARLFVARQRHDAVFRRRGHLLLSIDHPCHHGAVVAAHGGVVPPPRPGGGEVVRARQRNGVVVDGGTGAEAAFAGAGVDGGMGAVAVLDDGADDDADWEAEAAFDGDEAPFGRAGISSMV